MLELMRRHRKGILGSGMIVFCAMLMLVFGLGGGMGGSGGGRPNVAAKIGDLEIPYRDYARNLRFIDSRMRNQLGGAYDQFKSQLNLEQQAIDASISQAVLNDFISNSGFTASQGEVQREIASMPYFRNEGLNKESLQRFLSATGLNAASLEHETKQQIIRDQLSDLFKDLNIFSEAEARKEFDRKHKESTFRVVKLSGPDFEDKVKVDDEEALRAFYQESEEQFRKPSAVQYRFVKFLPASFKSAVEVTADDINLEYQDMKQAGRFNVPAQVRLRQIVIKKEQTGALEELVSPGEKAESAAPMSGDSEAERIKGKAEKVLERLNNKEDFAALATELSGDQTSAQKGGDLGMKAYRELNPKIASEARKLDLGEYSEAIDLPDGLYIIKVEGAEDERVKPLDEVEQEVQTSVRTGLSGEYAYAEAEQVFDEWKAGGKTLEELASANKLTVLKTEKLLSGGEVAKAGIPGLTSKVIDYGEGARELVLIGETPILIETTEFKESFIPSFEEAKEDLVKSYKSSERGILAKERAEALLESLVKSENNSSLVALAEKEGLTIETTKKGTRASANEPVFNAANARKVLFALDSPGKVAKQVFEMGEDFYIAELAQTSQAEGSNWEEEKVTIVEQLKNRSSARLNSALQETLKKNHNSVGETWVNPDLKI